MRYPITELAQKMSLFLVVIYALFEWLSYDYQIMLYMIIKDIISSFKSKSFKVM